MFCSWTVIPICIILAGFWHKITCRYNRWGLWIAVCQHITYAVAAWCLFNEWSNTEEILLLHLTQILSVSPAWAITCNYVRWIVAAELEIYPREHCEFYMGKGVAENLRNGGLTKAKFNLGGRGNWTMMMVMKTCAKLLGCVKQMSGHYFHTDHVNKLLFSSFLVCRM
jgi:hypothetical protein